MELIISKSELNKALLVTQSMVARKTTMPILLNVLLSASDNQLKISASDLEVTAVVVSKAQIRSRGSTTVSAKVFGDIVRELPEGDVSLKLTEGERLEIKSGKSSFKVVGISADEYPSLPGVSLEIKNRISASKFIEMIDKTLYASSNDETRFNLNGVCFELLEDGKDNKKHLRMVAVDGFRLSMITRPIDGLEFGGKPIVPRRGLAEVARVLGRDEEKEIGIDIRDGFLALQSDGTKIIMRLIDGEFPNYNQVLPKDVTKAEGRGTCTVSINALSQALKRVALVVSDKVKGVKLDFSPESLRISSSSPELGEASEELPISYQGNPISVGFNALYLLDIASSMGEDQTLKIDLHGELGPGKFSSDTDDSYVAVVMPMRL